MQPIKKPFSFKAQSCSVTSHWQIEFFHFLLLHLCLSSGRDVRHPNKLRIQFQLGTNLEAGACGEENWNAKLWKKFKLNYFHVWSRTAVEFRAKAFNSVLLSFHMNGLPLKALLARNICAKIIPNTLGNVKRSQGRVNESNVSDRFRNRSAYLFFRWLRPPPPPYRIRHRRSAYSS